MVEEGDDPHDRKPCPACGSKMRRIEASSIVRLPPFKGILAFRTRLSNASWSKGSKEFVVGDDMSDRTQKYNIKFRCIDRPGGIYLEIVKDPETGEIIHQCAERLSKHLGHGSDKKNR
jgi:hypothetical protein